MKCVESVLYWTWCLLFFPVLFLLMLAATVAVSGLLVWVLFALAGVIA